MGNFIIIFKHNYAIEINIYTILNVQFRSFFQQTACYSTNHRATIPFIFCVKIQVARKSRDNIGEKSALRFTTRSGKKGKERFLALFVTPWRIVLRNPVARVSIRERWPNLNIKERSARSPYNGQKRERRGKSLKRRSARKSSPLPSDTFVT